MPRRIERDTGLTLQQKELLMTGCGWLALSETWGENALRVSWAECKDELMREWHADPAHSFSRPWAWWEFSDHRRVRVRGTPQPYDVDGELAFGCPVDYTDQELDESTMEEIEYLGSHPFFETQREYLIRHPELLLPAEIEALKTAPAPEDWPAETSNTIH